MNVVLNTNDMLIVKTINDGKNLSEVELKENEAIYELPNALTTLYSIAKNYILTLDEINSKIVDITVTKTIEEWLREQPIIPQQTQEDYMLDLDFRISKIEMGV